MPSLTPPPPLRGQFLYPKHGQKQTFFDPLPPHLVLAPNRINLKGESSLKVSFLVMTLSKNEAKSECRQSSILKFGFNFNFTH